MIFSRSPFLKTAVFCALFCCLPVVAAPDKAAAKKAEPHNYDQESVRLMKAGEDEKALTEIENGLKDVKDPTLVRRKAQCLLNLERPKQALLVAKEAVKLEPDNFEAHQILGAVYDALKMDTEAINELSISVAEKPADKGSRAAREKVYERQHQYAKAAEDLTFVINSSTLPNRSKPLERRAYCYVQLKDYGRAITDLSSALRGSFGRSDLLRQRAALYEKTGNSAAAQKDLKAAQQMDGDLEPPSTMGALK